jgi:hypothetical protein
VGVGIIRLQADGFIKVLDGSLLLAKVAISNPPTGVSLSMIRFQADGLIINF